MSKPTKPSPFRASPSLAAKQAAQATEVARATPTRELPRSVMPELDMTKAAEIIAGASAEQIEQEARAAVLANAAAAKAATQAASPKPVIPRRKRAPVELKAITVRIGTELLARVDALQDQMVASERRTVTLQEIVAKALDAYVAKHLTER